MDKITKSLKKYLDSAGIPHQTLFNSEDETDMACSTSTCFHLKNIDNPQQRMLVVVNIYPRNKDFWIQSYPIEVFRANNPDKLRAFEAKWNRGSGLVMTNLRIAQTKKRYITTPNHYYFQLNLFSFCDSDGLRKTIWEKYIEQIENATELAWENINEILRLDEFSNKPDASDKASKKTSIVDEVPF